MRLASLLTIILFLTIGAGWASIKSDQTNSSSPKGFEATVSTPVLSPRRMPRALLQTQRHQKAAEAVAEAVSDDLTETTCLVVMDQGHKIYSYNPLKPLIPASTQKILVATAILSLMESSETFATTAKATALPNEGVLEGNLYLVGGGDPILSTDAYRQRQSDPTKPTTRFEDLADAVAAAGVTEIRGGIVGDGSRYDDEYYVESWEPRYREQLAAGPISGLNVNDGLVSFTPTEVPAYPGQPANDPPAHAAQLLTELLDERGVVVHQPPTSGRTPEGAQEVAHIQSPPLSDVLSQMLLYSDNNTAELLTKEIAVRSNKEGSTTSGTQAIVNILEANGIDIKDVILKDGSGLHLGNQLSCETLAQVVSEFGSNPPLYDALPVAGGPGTLNSRMTDTPAAGNLRAKTGSLRHVSALAGLVTATDGTDYWFSYIKNFPGDQPVPEENNDTQTAIAVALATLTEPELPAVVPPAGAQLMTAGGG